MSQDRRLPLVALSAFHTAPTEVVRVERVKVIFVTAGWSVLHTPEGDLHMSPGTVAVIPKGLACAGTPATFTRTVTLYLHDEFLASQLPWLPPAHPLVQHLIAAQIGKKTVGVTEFSDANVRAIEPLLGGITELSQIECSAFALLARLAELFDALTHISVTSGATPELVRDRALVPRRAVLDAMRVLHEDLARSWTMHELAQVVALSKSQLARLFRQDLGSSPAAVLRAIRTERMADLLASRDLTIAEAARMVGWREPAAAGRAFRTRYGQTPSAYAKRIRHPNRAV